jgi:hypothetical protein
MKANNNSNNNTFLSVAPTIVNTEPHDPFAFNGLNQIKKPIKPRVIKNLDLAKYEKNL